MTPVSEPLSALSPAISFCIGMFIFLLQTPAPVTVPGRPAASDTSPRHPAAVVTAGRRGLVGISLGNIAISYHSVISCALVNSI